MNYNEALHILAILEIAYPNVYRNLPKEKAESTAQLWASSFADIDGTLVIEGVKAFIVSDASGFAPGIGQIRKLITTRGGNNTISETQAWAMVNKALKNSGYNSVEEFAKLPPVVQQAVGSPSVLREWSLMPIDEVQSVIASHFMRNYRAKLEVAEFNNSLPEATRKRLGIIAEQAVRAIE